MLIACEGGSRGGGLLEGSHGFQGGTERRSVVADKVQSNLY